MPHKYKKGKPMIVGQDFAPPIGPLLDKTSEPKKLSLSSPSAAPASPKDVAAYSAEMLMELRSLAAEAGLTFLVYLIQVAVEEAKIQADDHEDR
jgi:hypothetical protein